jgi:DNA-binding NtrC family response regulator
VFEVKMPPLRERKEDIPLLVDHFISEFGDRDGRAIDGITRDALQLMKAHHWPGNVRQLRNAVEHACVTAAGDRISYLDLPIEIRDQRRPAATDAADQLTAEELAERQRIVRALRQTGGNRTKAAKLLHTSRVTLWKKINRYQISVPVKTER